jgi:hypothetical protein
MERHWPGAWFHVAVGSEEREALLICPSRDLLFHHLLSHNLSTTETKRHGGETGDNLMEKSDSFFNIFKSGLLNIVDDVRSVQHIISVIYL